MSPKYSPNQFFGWGHFDKKTKGEKKKDSSLKCIQKSNVIKKKFGF